MKSYSFFLDFPCKIEENKGEKYRESLGPFGGGKDRIMEYVIGIDLGTSGTKTVLFDRAGQVMASATVEYPMYQPKNGWAEQDPTDWWDAAVGTLRPGAGGERRRPRRRKRSGHFRPDARPGHAGRNRARCCASPSSGATSAPPAECEEITERVGAQRLIEITANPALTGFTASKILWVRNHEPEIYAKCRHILLPKDYVRYMLTGEFATEVSDASGMQLLDVTNRCWSREVLEKLEIDPSLLAKMYESPEITGTVTAEAAALTGLKEGTPVVGGAGDNAAAAVGTGVVRGR